MSRKSLKVTFGAEVLVFALVLIIMCFENFSWSLFAVLVLVFLISLFTFYTLYKKLPSPKK